MLRMTQKCRYALRAVFELALRNPSQPVKINEIAGAQDIPVRFLETILNQLRHAGFVESKRGSGGGYMLAQSPIDINIGDIIRSIQGPISIKVAERKKDEKAGSFYGDYAFKHLWGDINHAISQVCDNMTFAELIGYEEEIKKTSLPVYSI
ncbi:MAG: RrF2 family transcriptional regulator [Planctomycetota bacterium]|jgi:Rrf2 family protein